MSDTLSIGGRRRTDLYRIQENSTGTAYEFLNGVTGTTGVTEPTITDVALSATLIKSSDVAYNEDGTCKLTLEQYDAGSDVWAFLDKVAVPATATSKPELVLENGDKMGGATGSGDLVLAISYLFYDDESNPTKVFTHFAVGRIAPTSGSFKTDAEAYVQPTFEFNSINTAYSLTIPAGVLRTGTILASTVTDQTLAAGKGFKRVFLDKYTAE